MHRLTACLPGYRVEGAFDGSHPQGERACAGLLPGALACVSGTRTAAKALLTLLPDAVRRRTGRTPRTDAHIVLERLRRHEDHLDVRPAPDALPVLLLGAAGELRERRLRASTGLCGAMQPGWPLSLCLWIKIECACAAGRRRQRRLRASTGLLRDAARLTPDDVLTGSNAVCLVGGAQRACLACSLTPLHGHGGQPPACRPLCGLFCWRQQCLHNAEQPLQLLSNGGQHKACAGAPWARP